MWRRPRLLLHSPRFTAFAFYPEIGLIVSLSDGTRLGAYEIIGQIGVGMGVVYRARDTDLKRDVAIKTLPASSAKPRCWHR